MTDWWKQLLDTARDVAPSLAGAAATAATGGNVAAGAAVAAIARRLTGAGQNADLNDVAADILADPDKVLQFRLDMRKGELDELKIRTLDIQDARKTLTVSRGAVVVSVVVTSGYFLCMILVMTLPVPAGSQNLMYLLLGNLSTGFGMVLTFWLGSSTGSKAKDEVMATYVKAAQADAAARRVVELKRAA